MRQRGIKINHNINALENYHAALEIFETKVITSKNAHIVTNSSWMVTVNINIFKEEGWDCDMCITQSANSR